MTDKSKQFLDYLDISIKTAAEVEGRLIMEDRKDESIHKKVKGNVFNIFKTVFLFINKNKELKDDNINPLFLEKLDTIPESWKASYEQAKNHNDYEKVVIEEIKLTALDEIRKKFLEIWE